MLRYLAISLLLVPSAARGADATNADVVVYTATAGGALASVAAARQGAKVVLVEPGKHVGGMFSGGLSHADVNGQENLIGGLAKEVFQRIATHYGKQDFRDAFLFEPHVAEETLRAMLKEAGVSVVFGQRVESVTKRESRIVSFQSQSGQTYAAKVFVDAGYEGDLMAKCGVKYAVGREGRKQYDEWLAGRCDLIPSTHQFKFPVSPWKEEKLLPLITPQTKLAATGEGDGKFQPYCFRLCLTDKPKNQLPVTQPEGYNSDDYELLRRHNLAAKGEAPEALHLTRVPGGKSDANSAGPVSSNLLGGAWEYPDASYERRAEIWREHLRWAQGLLWFTQNDPSMSDKQRTKMRRWALCKDEFTDTGGWPHQLYVREGRRMLGEYVVTQHDLESRRDKPDSVGMCGYNIDIREVQWVAVRVYHFPDAGDEVYTEGYISQPVEPWQVPYRALTPKAAECENLLVPVCASLSTIAYGSFRMEPGYMIVGHASGVAAALAAKEGVAVQKVNYASLRKLLLDGGQILDAPARK